MHRMFCMPKNLSPINHADQGNKLRYFVLFSRTSMVELQQDNVFYYEVYLRLSSITATSSFQEMVVAPELNTYYLRHKIKVLNTPRCRSPKYVLYKVGSEIKRKNNYGL